MIDKENLRERVTLDVTTEEFDRIEKHGENKITAEVNIAETTDDGPTAVIRLDDDLLCTSADCVLDETIRATIRLHSEKNHRDKSLKIILTKVNDSGIVYSGEHSVIVLRQADKTVGCITIYEASTDKKIIYIACINIRENI